MHAQSLIKAVPMEQIFLPREILKKAVGFLQVDFFSETKNDLFCKRYFLNNNEEC